MNQKKTLDEIIKPKIIDGKIKTKFRLSTILKKINNPKFDQNHDKLRRELIQLGAIKFENQQQKGLHKELWGLAVENLDDLGFQNKRRISKIVSKIKEKKGSMPRFLVQILLSHPIYHKRKFSTLLDRLKGIDENQLRRTIVFAGGLPFFAGNEEYWGFALQNLNSLGFTETNAPKFIVNKIKEQSERMPYHLAELVLENPVFYRRSFFAIKRKLAGFSESELRSILTEIDAVQFADKDNNVYWGLSKRNQELLK